LTVVDLPQLEWRENENGDLRGFHPDGRQALWSPLPGSQQAYDTCPVFEVLYEGTRGNGKTDNLLWSFAKEVGKGWGPSWKGIIFRPEHVQLEEIINKAKEWFTLAWPNSTFNEGKSVWQWPTGEKLYFRHVKRLANYWKYHGHQYPFIGWEELCTWADDKLYRRMMSCCRSAKKGMPRKYRSNANPYGVGHNWVKDRFRLPVARGKVVGPIIRTPQKFFIDGEERTEILERVAIHGDIRENKILLHAQPTYIAELVESATSEAERKAWVEGDWNIVAGGMFDDLWNPRIHVLPNIPFNQIPRRWKINRAYDHGQSKPFSCGWYAESNGESIVVEGVTIGAIPGDVIRIAEWYGWNGKPNEGLRMLATEIADGILEREEDWGIRGRVRAGPGDVNAFDPSNKDHSVFGDMKKHGVTFNLADKGKNSRVLGWQQMRKMLKYAVPDPTGYREEPGLFVCERCVQFVRTIPVLPRSEKNMDDADTDAEDHLADEVRYRCREKRKVAKSRSF